MRNKQALSGHTRLAQVLEGLKEPHLPSSLARGLRLGAAPTQKQSILGVLLRAMYITII